MSEKSSYIPESVTKSNIYKKGLAVVTAAAITFSGLSTEAFADTTNQAVDPTAGVNPVTENIGNSGITTTHELSTNQEVNNVSNIDRKLILQVDSPYYLSTNSAIGSKNVMNKIDTNVSMVNGRTLVPVRLAESLGYEVKWNDATKTATLKNETKTVKLVLGSNIMTVDEIGKDQKVITMDTTAQIDKNGRTVIPIGFFGREAMGVEVQYDAATKTVGVNYSKTEFDQVKKVDVITKQNIAKALPYIAGGEFMDITQFKNKVENIGGTVVIFPTENPTAAQRDLVKKNANNLKGKAVVSVCGERINYINPNNLNTISYDKSAKAINSLNPITTWKVQFSQNGNMVCVDNGRITFDYDVSKNFWNERANPTELGTKKQLICKKLDNILNNGNLYSINADEVKQYKQTGSDEGLKTFQTVKYTDGQPAFVLITNENGIQGENLEYFKTSMDRLNEIDSTTLHELTEKFGMDIVATAEKNWKDIFGNTGYGGTYFTKCGSEIIYLNNKVIFDFDKNSEVSKTYSITKQISTIIDESRALYHKNLNDNSSKNHTKTNLTNISAGLDKANYLESLLIKWLKNSRLNSNEKFGFEKTIEVTRLFYGK